MLYRRGMEFRQIRYVLALADELHFRRAAERAHVSQPALSQALKALEEELGVRLIDRSTRGVRLTAAGELFARRGRQLLHDAELLKAGARLAGRGERASLTIGLNELAGQQPAFGSILRHFRASHPEIALELADMGEAAQVSALERGQIDAGFHYRLSGSHAGLATRVLNREAYRLLLPEGHPLATRDRIRLEDLADEPLIMLRREVNADTHDGILRAFAERGLEPRVVLETASDAAMLTLVAEGMGLAIVMGANRRGGWQGLRLMPVEGLSLAKEFVLAWNADNPAPALAQFVACAEPG
ncbi:MAG TPA: LysR family transcriptional regulator [Novosphingobium sp.]|nr:LysR family transcriptional regulator [Novosphingobium sp.]